MSEVKTLVETLSDNDEVSDTDTLCDEVHQSARKSSRAVGSAVSNASEIDEDPPIKTIENNFQFIFTILSRKVSSPRVCFHPLHLPTSKQSRKNYRPKSNPPTYLHPPPRTLTRRRRRPHPRCRSCSRTRPSGRRRTTRRRNIRPQIRQLRGITTIRRAHIEKHAIRIILIRIDDVRASDVVVCESDQRITTRVISRPAIVREAVLRVFCERSPGSTHIVCD